MLWRRRGLRHCWAVMGKDLMLRGGMTEEVVLVMTDVVEEIGEEEMAVVVVVLAIAANVEGTIGGVIKMVEVEEMKITVEGVEKKMTSAVMMRGLKEMIDVQAMAEETDE